MTNLNPTVILIIIFFSIHPLAAQTADADKIFSNTQGIKQTETVFYEVEGYSVFVQDLKLAYDEKGVGKVKKKYGFGKETLPVTDADFPGSKVLISTNHVTADVNASGVYYLFPEGEKETKVIGLLTSLKRDTAFEKFFVKAIVDKTIPNRVYVPMLIDSINFAGRYIPLGPVCEWMGTHNIQCSEMGQLNWAEFRTLERAQEMIVTQFAITARKPLGEVMQQDTVDVLVEGYPTKALCATFKIKIPQLIMGGSNILKIYYVAVPVRGKYIACVLSHYTDAARGNDLPPLLSKVMQLKR